MNVDENIINKIDSTLVQKSENEGAMRIIFQMARANAETEIAELMADFRNKQALGKLSVYLHPLLGMAVSTGSHPVLILLLTILYLKPYAAGGLLMS